jgi:hypothetical protein
VIFLYGYDPGIVCAFRPHLPQPKEKKDELVKNVDEEETVAEAKGRRENKVEKYDKEQNGAVGDDYLILNKNPTEETDVAS